MDLRNWPLDKKKLNQHATPQDYTTRRSLALDFLTTDNDGYHREDVRSLLVTIESRPDALDLPTLANAAMQANKTAM